jgi:hypothetical protein
MIFFVCKILTGCRTLVLYAVAGAGAGAAAAAAAVAMATMACLGDDVILYRSQTRLFINRSAAKSNWCNMFVPMLPL